MNSFPWKVTFFVCSACLMGIVAAQPPGDREQGGFGPGGPGGSGGFGGPGQQPDREIVKDFDRDDNGWLNHDERAAAREFLRSEPLSERPGGPGFGPPGSGPPGRGPGGPRGAGGRGGPGGRGQREPAKAGPEVAPADVPPITDAPLYEPTALRTIFLEFENADWEKELEDFHGSDVDVAATMTVDGTTYPNVGVHFRGMSSYFMVPTGHKRSFNVSLDLDDKDQRLYGYKTLNLLNSNGDPSFMSTVLYSEIARQYLPAPKANHVRVVVNGKSWGVYVNVQQFDKTFLEENFKSSKGTRWKVSGSPGADGGLRYLGDDVEEYKRRYEVKSNDSEKAWTALIELCRTLNETPLEQLESALEPMLDIDGALKFLALDVGLVNSDGYWTRASDYNIFRDDSGRFHIIPHDMNEAFQSGGPRGGGPPGGFGPPNVGGPPAGGGIGIGPPPEGRNPGGRGGDRGFGPPGGGGRGPGGPGGPGHGGVDLDPLINVDNPRMPLRSRLLAVPELRTRYLEYIREIADKSLDWNTIGPVVVRQSQLIHEQVAADTRKLDSLAAFEAATSADEVTEKPEDPSRSLRSFFQQRRKFLLEGKSQNVSKVDDAK